MQDDLSEPEIQRYARNILLPEIGGAGQAALRRAAVLIVGAGGLGCPALLYLAASGVGRVGLVDDDHVELSNLQRQIAHRTADLGMPKVASALTAARALNPLVDVSPHAIRLDQANATSLIAPYDIVCDGSDNFTTRAIVAATCRRLGKTLVSAAVTRFEGQLAVFRPPDRDEGAACYRCLYPQPAPPGVLDSCAEAGVLGPVAGVIGAYQALEAIKEILGIGKTLAGRLLIWDALAVRFRTIALVRDPACPCCGQSGTAGGQVPIYAQGAAPA